MKTPTALGKKPQVDSDPAIHIAIAIVLVVCAMMTSAFLAKYGLIPWTTLIFVAGTVGGVVNSFRRMQMLSVSKVLESNAMTGRLIAIQIYLSPFVGGVFAIVLYAIFMSGFVQGSLFPAFASGDHVFTTFREFADQARPATNTDMAKSIIWDFIAGFLEGLVPNFISKIAKDVDPKNKPDV
ncbi:MAG: hypothetical protein D8M57_16465 [Candidatus Scalindua sp. AMX11]|nr:MAG: hypothetical protein DWQ00_02600 [Candidatus Scalindua sp.]NOG83970.1 hypothetical protein [Planctomycetota bacterium]RZV88039.1 MAG: hypothetical protein EX341_06945 [Candidatus Scalindua sp. SCAELEC01]TDE63792.1 MAG: hypothetical protein D8M57_16465 [Candidatus Scalindua sp. AMX11]GJQ58382.1 MAG: hypothetical protein SCALA701_11830 [Candidatus Scalindua sp.]